MLIADLTSSNQPHITNITGLGTHRHQPYIATTRLVTTTGVLYLSLESIFQYMTGTIPRPDASDNHNRAHPPQDWLQSKSFCQGASDD